VNVVSAVMLESDVSVPSSVSVYVPFATSFEVPDTELEPPQPVAMSDNPRVARQIRLVANVNLLRRKPMIKRPPNTRAVPRCSGAVAVLVAVDFCVDFRKWRRDPVLMEELVPQELSAVYRVRVLVTVPSAVAVASFTSKHP
jgi:hypothetical protein